MINNSCFRWQEATKLVLMFNTKTSNLVILYDLMDLMGNITSMMTKHDVGYTVLLSSLFKLFYAINHNLLMLFSRVKYTREMSHWLKPLRETHHIPIPMQCTPTTPEQEVRTKHSMYPIEPKDKRHPVNSDKLMLWLWRSQEPTNEICSWWAFSQVTFSWTFSSTKSILFWFIVYWNVFLCANWLLSAIGIIWCVRMQVITTVKSLI